MSRWRYLLRRVLLSIPVVIFGLTITFVIIRMGPIDPASAILGQDTSPAQRAQIEARLGLNRPLWEQYLDFMASLLLPWQFDLGESWVIQSGTNVSTLIGSYAPRTLWLGFWSVLLPVFVGIPLGFYAGLHPNTWGDYVASFGGIIWRAMPNFWLAVMFLAILRQSERFLFGIDWRTFLVETSLVGPPDLGFVGVTEWTSFGFVNVPAEVYFSGMGLLAAIKQVLPAALVLGSASLGNELRIGRTAVLETINSNYVETAKAKGLKTRAIVWKHVFRNALIPLVPIITNEAFLLIGGSVIVEYVFAINGIGYLFFQAAVQGDLPVVGSLMFIFILVIVGINILQDVLYTILDPRVGYER